MAKAAFGEYGAFTTKNSVRYQKHNKLVKEDDVPPEVVAYLNKQLNYTPKPKDDGSVPIRVPLPTEEEKRALREASLQVPDHLKGVNTEATEEDQAKPVEPAPEVVDEPLTEEDFDTSPESDTPPEEGDEGAVPPHDEPDPQSEFMESVSIHTASLEDIVEALYERFGIYTVYRGELPVQDEVNPLTGEAFTKYHLGIAYQAAVKAKATGLLDIPAEEGRRAIDEGRRAHQEFAVDTPAQNLAEARRQDSFAYRTSPSSNRKSVRTEIAHEIGADGKMHAVQVEIPEGELGKNNGAQARYDKDEEQMIIQPRMGKPVIRPNWK